MTSKHLYEHVYTNSASFTPRFCINTVQIKHQVSHCLFTFSHWQLTLQMAEVDKKDTSSSMDVKEESRAPEFVVGDSSRVDPEVAKYASDVIDIDDATNQRLKWKLYRRVLPIMVVTYFLQALDKGTLSFSSIMNLPQDIGLVGQQVIVVMVMTSG